MTTTDTDRPRPWRFTANYEGGPQPVDYGTGTAWDGTWFWCIYLGPDEVGELDLVADDDVVLVGMAGTDPTPALRTLVTWHNLMATGDLSEDDIAAAQDYADKGQAVSRATVGRLVAAVLGLGETVASLTHGRVEVLPPEPTATQLYNAVKAKRFPEGLPEHLAAERHGLTIPEIDAVLAARAEHLGVPHRRHTGRDPVVATLAGNMTASAAGVDLCPGSGVPGYLTDNLWCCPHCRYAVDSDQPRKLPDHPPAERKATTDG